MLKWQEQPLLVRSRDVIEKEIQKNQICEQKVIRSHSITATTTTKKLQGKNYYIYDKCLKVKKRPKTVT